MPGAKATPSKKRKSQGLSDSSSDDDKESPAKAKAKAAPPSRTSEGSSAPTIKFCFVCSDPAYGRFDVCQEHKRVRGNMKYQAEHSTPPQTEVFNATMADKTQARTAILDYEKVSCSSSKFRHKPLINWIKFAERYGERVSNLDQELTRPFEQKEFIYRCMKKKCWSREDSQSEWNRCEASSANRDWQGLHGCLRLFINYKTMRVNQTETYVDKGQEGGSDNIKNFKAADVDAIRVYAHRSSASSAHEFFQGQSHEEAKDAAKKRRTADDDDSDGVAAPESANTNQADPNSNAMRAAVKN